MNRTMFALTLLLLALVITHDRLKSWMLERTDFQFNIIVTAAIFAFLALFLRSFHLI